MGPKLSVVIPIYRKEKYLRQCLDSVVNQTFRDMEIILVDDGSPDNCGKICDEYAQRDDRITVVHKRNEGLSAARNEGIARAKGEWIAFVDPDDWIEEAFYEQLFEALGAQAADIFLSGGCFFDYVGRTEISRDFIKPFLFGGREQIEPLRAKVICATRNETGSVTEISPVWNKLYRTAFLNQNKLVFDVSFRAWEDYWFNFMALAKAGAVGGCACVGYHYRQVATSLTHRFDPQMAEKCDHFIEKLYSCIEECEANGLIAQAVEVRSLTFFIQALKCCYFHPANPKPYKEIAQEVRAMKTRPYYQRMIHSRGNPYFGKKQRIFKWLLRMPWIWPLKLAHDASRLSPGKILRRVSI